MPPFLLRRRILVLIFLLMHHHFSLSMIIDKPLFVESTFKAFGCSSFGEQKISTILSTYSNICMAMLSRHAPEILNLNFP